ncbi:MAG: hypothetical protein AAFU61_10945, partial [Pseudomonadota bacterium]
MAIVDVFAPSNPAEEGGRAGPREADFALADPQPAAGGPEWTSPGGATGELRFFGLPGAGLAGEDVVTSIEVMQVGDLAVAYRISGLAIRLSDWRAATAAERAALLFGGIDQVVGSQAEDALRAGGGNDFVQGERGDDEIDGGAGDDRLEGGGGRDV